VRGQTLIVNLPGSPGGVRDGLGVLGELVEHAVELVRGVKTGHWLFASESERRWAECYCNCLAELRRTRPLLADGFRTRDQFSLIRDRSLYCELTSSPAGHRVERRRALDVRAAGRARKTACPA
jgi:hypothetical protein